MFATFAIVSGLSWAASAALPSQVRQNMEMQIRRDLQKRTLRCKCQIDGTQIHFGELKSVSPSEKEIVYEVAFAERSSQGVTHFQIEKKLVFNSSWEVVKVHPLQQEVKFDHGAEIAL